MPDAASTAKRSIMLPRAPMPFWHIVKVVCSSVYQIKILFDEGIFWHFVFFLDGCHWAREGVLWCVYCGGVVQFSLSPFSPLTSLHPCKWMLHTGGG